MPAKYDLKAYCIREFGKRRDANGNPHQEDSIFPSEEHLADTDRLFILCDGMGGHDAGEVASATVCEAMGQAIADDGHDAEGVFTDDDLRMAVKAALAALDKADTGKSEKKMGTTMTLLKLHNEGATIAHIGDSRVYHIRPGKTGTDTRILFQTEDHSLVNDLVRVGELTREEARHSNQKNVITRAMQPRMARPPKADIHHTADIRPGDYFYLCSDGMLEQDDMDSGETLRNIFSEEGGDDVRKVEILKGATADNSDNHTAFIIHILDAEGLPEKAETTPPAAPRAGKGAAPTARKGDKPADAPTRKKLSIGTLILRLLIVVAVVVLCFLGVRMCNSDKEQPAETIDVETLQSDEEQYAPEEKESRPKRRIQTVTPVPAKQNAQPAREPQQNAEPAKTEPAKEEPAAPARKVKVPSKKTESDEDVVNSDQQNALDNLKKKN